MIDLYYWPTSNGRKITIMLHEVELPYRIIPVNFKIGEQFAPEFLAINPNNKIPAIVDHPLVTCAEPTVDEREGVRIRVVFVTLSDVLSSNHDLATLARGHWRAAFVHDREFAACRESD